MSTQTGYYALLQLSPQPDSEEAVNVGVYLLCPQAGWAELASLPELPGRARAMFPDLPEWLYALALEQQAAQLAQMKQHALHQPPSDWLAQAHAYLAPEEGILRLGTLRHVCVADHPEQALFKLFVQYVPQPSTVEERPHLTPMKRVLPEWNADPLQYVSNWRVTNLSTSSVTREYGGIVDGLLPHRLQGVDDQGCAPIRRLFASCVAYYRSHDAIYRKVSNLEALETFGHENDVDNSYGLLLWASRVCHQSIPEGVEGHRSGTNVERHE